MNLKIKCKKLLAMTESPNKHEATVAAKKLAELIARKGVDVLPAYRRVDTYA